MNNILILIKKSYNYYLHNEMTSVGIFITNPYNKIQNNISLTGWLSDQEIITHLKSSDIFVLPSWYEGMPNSLIEALASGLPSICSSVGIIPDYVIDGVNGLLIQPNDKLNLEL